MGEKTIATMTESELRKLIAEIVDERLAQRTDFSLPSDYNPDNDPMLKGGFEGPSDLSTNIKRHIHEAFEEKFKRD